MLRAWFALEIDEMPGIEEDIHRHLIEGAVGGLRDLGVVNLPKARWHASLGWPRAMPIVGGRR
jgi:hypothetical protein